MSKRMVWWCSACSVTRVEAEPANCLVCKGQMTETGWFESQSEEPLEGA